jgi:formylglycine-generating enzyme required for sulfatase activity
MNKDHEAHLNGDGALAQGDGAIAAGKQAVVIQGSGNTVTITYQGAEIAIPALDAVAAHRVALRVHLERRACQRWGSMATYIHEEGAALPLEASPYQTGRLGPREPLLPALRDAQRLLLLGGPGAGKSVSLERLAWDLCAGEEPQIPVLLPLFRYDGAALHAWIRAYLQRTGHLRLDTEQALTAFLKESPARCYLLCDGLNEVPPAHRDTLIGELTRWLMTYPRHPVVVTSRPQDELWRQVRGELERALVVQPISDDQAQAYLVDHLADKGSDLYARLDDRLRELARTPLILWLIKEAGGADEAIPGNRGELYARFVSRMLRRDTRRKMDAALPERHKRDALAQLAYHLGLEQRLACTHEEAVAVVAQSFDEAQSRTLIDACRRHGLLAGDQDLWFAPHQTVQEYFMALALRERWQQERTQPALRRWWRNVQRQVGRAPEDVLTQAADDWWMETFVQLAGLVDDADQLARDVSQVNPWLALWCVGEGRDVSDETQTLVEERSVYVLHSERLRDRRRAVEALAQIRNERVIEPLLWAAGYQDQEISSLAVQALGQLGKAVIPRAIAALENEDFRLGALRYAVTYPDEQLCARKLPQVWEKTLGFPVVWIPPGPFLMGSDKERDPQAYDDELPQHEVNLPGYWIGRTPVTVAQFRLFVEESGHEVDKRSLSVPEDHPVRYISWHDALAYCRWLSRRAGLPVTLPSEAEWEKAARGTDGRIYPWGDAPPTEDLCNFSGNVGDTTPVGRYSPQGDSPYGCADMAGNVWEWTRSHWKDYPYDSEDGRENLDAGNDVRRVLRGGAFYSDTRSVRCAYRGYYYPSGRLGDYGFRVVVSLFSRTK